MAKCGIVILNYRTFEDTLDCVQSIMDNEPFNQFNIYVVDNYSNDGSVEKLKSFIASNERISLIESRTNLGFSGGNNLGISAAIENNNDYIFLLNSDIVLLNNAISIMVESLRQEPDAVVVGPSIINLNNEYVQCAKKCLTAESFIFDKKLIRSIFRKKAHRSRFYDYDPDIDNTFVFDGMVSGCCMGFKTSFLLEHKMLDDSVFMYYEEDILAHVIKENHFKAIICNDAKVVHKEGTSVNKKTGDKLAFTRFHRWISSFYVLKKYAGIGRFFAFVVFLSYCFSWLLLSIFSKNYSKRKKDFFRRMKTIYHS